MGATNLQKTSEKNVSAMEEPVSTQESGARFKVIVSVSDSSYFSANLRMCAILMYIVPQLVKVSKPCSSVACIRC